MRVLLVFFVFLFACGSCGSKSEKKTKPSPISQAASDKGEFYCSKLTDAVFKERCDKITFKAMVAANCPQDLSGFEKDGRWERDEVQCYPDNSKSSISRDGMISVLHYVWTTKDAKLLQRLINYGEAHDWIMGDGPRDLTDATILTPMIYFIQGKLKNDSTALLDYLPTTEDIAQSFKGHVIANYIWLQARVRGNINAVEAAILNKLWEASMEDPMYTALMHRFVDGNQADTFSLLLNRPEFPNDSLPTETGVFDWGSAPASVYYLISLAIAEGK